RGSFMSVEFNAALRQLTVNCLETAFNCDLSYQGTIFNLLTLQKMIVPPFPPRIQPMDAVDIKEWLINVPNSPTVIPPTATNPPPAAQPPAATATNTPVPTIVVNTLTDELNNNGNCSLREAIKAANTNLPVDACIPTGGSDTITFSVNGTFTMSITGTDDTGLTGDYDITESLTIIGNGAANTIISGNSVDRVFHILAGTVSLSEMTISNGNPGTGISGGGVLVGGGAAALSNVKVINNTAAEGGGVRVNAATMTISGSTFNSNTATGNGGGIYNSGTLTMSGSTITGNTADSDSNGSGNGGGLWNGSTATLTSSTVSSNTAQDGGGITNNSSLTLNSVTLSNNNAKNNGGGVISVSTLSISNSTISGNTADSDNNTIGNGGGIYVGTSGSLTVSGGTIGGTGTGNKANLGGGIYATVTTSISGVLIEDNTASSGGGGGIQTAGGTTTIQNTTIKKNKGFNAGGGIHVATGGTVSISKSAIDQNTLTSGGAAGGGVYNESNFNAKDTSITANTATVSISNYGGGLYNSTGTSTLKNVTISNNTLSSGTGGGNGGGIYIVGGTVIANNVTIAYNSASGGTGGGIYIINSASTLQIGNTIISDNTALGVIDCDQDALATFTDKDHNLISTATTVAATPCTFSRAANNIFGSSANLAALAGTAPAYHALNTGSPAIDKGDAYGSATQACESNDTRGVARPVGSYCDIGAYEK
ncbi:MAG: CSLREA domain-containing protein, partial [Chloroflexi bacterium]|nr:CSLREA domain-containing protein [Chloroflexota bacterium]